MPRVSCLNPARPESLEGNRVQGRRFGELQSAQKGHVDTAHVPALDKDRRPVTRRLQVVGAQAFEDGQVLDFLQGEYIRTSAVAELQDRFGDRGELAIEHGFAPVPKQTLITPFGDDPRVDIHQRRGAILASLFVSRGLLELRGQECRVILAAVMPGVEEVFYVKCHEGEFGRRLADRKCAFMRIGCLFGTGRSDAAGGEKHQL